MGIIGLLGHWAGQAWLFPSLGPTIFLQAVTPDQPSARLWNTLAGHAIGVAAGFGALYLLHAQSDPPALSSGVLTIGRVAATALAIGATVALQLTISAQHPPAAATTLLITLGGLKPDWATVGSIIIGVALVAALGEGARQLHPGRQEDS
nr:HPP family protein [Rubellimicrobium arenae]